MDQLSRLDAKIARAAERAAAEKPPTTPAAAFEHGDHQPDGTVISFDMGRASDPEPEPEPAANAITMAEALAVIRNKLLADRALAYSWHCNIACMVRDAAMQPPGRVIDAIVADAAERIMGSLFDVHGAGAVAHMLAEESCERPREEPREWFAFIMLQPSRLPTNQAQVDYHRGMILGSLLGLEPGAPTVAEVNGVTGMFGLRIRQQHCPRSVSSFVRVRPYPPEQPMQLASMAALRQQQEHDKNARAAQMAAIIGSPAFDAVGRSILDEAGIKPKPIMGGAWKAIGDDDTSPCESNPL